MTGSGSTRTARALLALGMLLLLFIGAGPASASSSVVQRLVERLENGEDFRVRVQAALELGKTKDAAARLPLERSLGDGNAAVRAASAAALKVLADKRSIPALKRKLNDSSPSVRSQIKSTIASLESASRATDEKPRVRVLLGKMKDAKGVRSGALLTELEQTSRKSFDQIPGVRLVDSDGEDSSRLPMVMVTGQVRTLRQADEGSSVTFSAKVEYLVHRMPEQAIAGSVSGSASTTASKAEARDKRKNNELRRAVLSAAVESAVRRAPEALFAAAK